jgi:hypothetical protein
MVARASASSQPVAQKAAEEIEKPSKMTAVAALR